MPVADAEVLRRGCPAGDRGVDGCAEAALCGLGGRLGSGAPTPGASGKREGQILFLKLRPSRVMSAHVPCLKVCPRESLQTSAYIPRLA